jgi:hypothetical protein
VKHELHQAGQTITNQAAENAGSHDILRFFVVHSFVVTTELKTANQQKDEVIKYLSRPSTSIKDHPMKVS